MSGWIPLPPENLDDLEDVDLSGAATGDVLTRDSGGTWIAAAPGAGPGSDIRWSPIMDVKGSTDDPPDDEFDDTTGMSGSTNGLDAKWTAVSGTSGSVSLVETGEVERYDLTTRPGWLLMQAGSAADQKVELRQDFTLGDGDSVLVAMSGPFAASDGSTGIANNELRYGMTLNDNDAGHDAGTYFGIMFDTADNGIRLMAFDGTTTFGATSDSSGSMSIPIGQLIYLRLMRVSTAIRAYWSSDGSTWMPLGVKTISPDNLWIWKESVVASGEPVPIVAVYWVRQGGNGFDPW